MSGKLFDLYSLTHISILFFWAPVVNFRCILSFKTYRRPFFITGNASGATIHLISGYGKGLLIGLWTGERAAFDLSGIKRRGWFSEHPDLPALCPVFRHVYAIHKGRKINHN